MKERIFDEDKMSKRKKANIYIYIIYNIYNIYIYNIYIYICIYIYIYLYIYIYIYIVFSTDGFFEVAIESWPEWDLDPRPLNSIQTLQPTELSGHEFNSHSEPTLHDF